MHKIHKFNEKLNLKFRFEKKKKKKKKLYN